MNRSLLALFPLLMACAVSGAPAPKPQLFVSGWEKPVDPDRDCNIRREKGTLIMEMPGRDHDYDPLRKQFNAPRLFREHEIEGDFTMQVRVRIDCQPSVQSTVDGKPPSVSAGFLVILPANAPSVCHRNELETSRKGSGAEGYVAIRQWFHHKRQGGKLAKNGTVIEKGWKGDAYLRLDRRDGDLGFSISRDGENWKGLCLTVGIREKLKVGLAAYSTSTEPSKVVFDHFRLTQDRKKKQ